MTRVHGGYLKSPLDSDHLQVNPIEGLYTFRDLEVCTEAINALLPNSLVHLTGATIKLVQLQLPSLMQIAMDPIVIVVQDVEVNLCSAAQSGCSVNHNDTLKVSKERDSGRGLNYLTSLIGSILSNIEVSVTRLTVNVRASPDSLDFLSLSFPSINYNPDKGRSTDEAKVKTLTFTEMEISYIESFRETLTGFYSLFKLATPLRVWLSFTEDRINVSLVHDSLQFIVTKDQFLAVFGILAQLSPTALVKEEPVTARLTEFTDAIGDLQLPLNQKIVTVHLELRSMRVVLGLDQTAPFTKVMNEAEGALHFSGSHAVLALDEILIEKQAEILLSVGDVSVSSHILISRPAPETQSLYYSANSMINSDFLRRTNSSMGWEVDFSKQHFCSNFLLKLSPCKVNGQEDMMSNKPSLLIDMTSNQFSITSSDVHIFFTEATLAKLVEFKFPQLPKTDKSHFEPSYKFVAFLIPALSVIYQQSDGLCSCEGVRRMLKYSCKELTFSSDHDVTIRVVDSYLRMAQDGEIEQDLVYNSEINVEVSLDMENLEAIKNLDVSFKHEKDIPGEGLAYRSNIRIIDEPIKLSKVEANFTEEYEFQRLPLGQYRSEKAQTLNITMNPLKLVADFTTLKKLQQFTFPSAPDDSKPNSSGYFAVNLGIKSVCLSLMEPNSDSSNIPKGEQLTGSYHALDSSKATHDNRVKRFKLIFGSVKAQFFTLPENATMMKVALKSAKLISKPSNACLLETDEGSQCLELSCIQTHKQDLDVSLSNFHLHLTELEPFIEYSSLVQFNPTSPDQRSNTTHVRLTNIGLSATSPQLSVWTTFDSIEVWSVKLASPSTMAVTVDLNSCRVELAEECIEIQASSGPPQGKFTEVVCIESTQAYFSLSKHNVKEQDFIGESSVLDCGFKDCEPFAPGVFVSKAPILESAGLTAFHLSIESIFVHSFKISVVLDLLKLFGGLISQPEESLVEEAKQDHEDTETPLDDLTLKGKHAYAEDEVTEEGQAREAFEIYNLGNSSEADDSEEAKQCYTNIEALEDSRIGLFIEPGNPNDTRSFSLHEYLEDILPPADDKPKDEDHQVAKFLHCHTELPQTMSASSQSVHSLRGDHGQPSSKFTATVGYLSINFYVGNGKSKGSQDCFRLKASQMAGSFCKFPKRHLHYNWKFGFSLEDFEVRDFISNSTVDRALHTLESKTLFTLAVESVFPAPLCNSSTEYVIAVKMQPIQINIDHIHVLYGIDYLEGLFKSPEMDKTLQTIEADHKRKHDCAKASDREAPYSESSPVSKDAQAPYAQLGIYLQRIEFSSIQVTVNLISNRAAIAKSCYQKMILPLLQYNLTLALPPVLIRAADDIFTAGTFIKDTYLSYLLARHIGTRISVIMSPEKLIYFVLELFIGTVLRPIFALATGGLRGFAFEYGLNRFLILCALGVRIFVRGYSIVQLSGMLFGVQIPSKHRVFKSLVYEMEYRLGILRPM